MSRPGGSLNLAHKVTARWQTSTGCSRRWWSWRPKNRREIIWALFLRVIAFRIPWRTSGWSGRSFLFSGSLETLSLRRRIQSYFSLRLLLFLNLSSAIQTTLARCVKWISLASGAGQRLYERCLFRKSFRALRYARCIIGKLVGHHWRRGETVCLRDSQRHCSRWRLHVKILQFYNINYHRFLLNLHWIALNNSRTVCCCSVITESLEQASRMAMVSRMAISGIDKDLCCAISRATGSGSVTDPLSC